MASHKFHHMNKEKLMGHLEGSRVFHRSKGRILGYRSSCNQPYIWGNFQKAIFGGLLRGDEEMHVNA